MLSFTRQERLVLLSLSLVLSLGSIAHYFIQRFSPVRRVVCFTEAVSRPPRVDLNGATPEQLRTVPGIGEVLARRIEDYRREHGGFEACADLKKVTGIGPRNYEYLAPFVMIGQQP